MTSGKFIAGMPLLAATAMVSLISMQELCAQQGGPPERLSAAITAMEAGKWQEAQVNSEAAIKAFDRRAKQLGLGDKFGQFWYIRGVSELNLQQYEKAIKTLEEGVTKYPGRDNWFILSSYLKMAEAAIELKDYDRALAFLKKLIEIRTKTPAAELNKVDERLPMGLIYALSAQCDFLSSKPDFENGVKNIKLIANNRYKGQGIPDYPIVQAFLSMANATIERDRPEVLLDFLKTGRSIVALEAWRLSPYAISLLNTANSALSRATMQKDEKKAAELMKVAQEILSLIPSIGEMEQSVKDVSDHLGNLPGIADTTVSYNKAEAKKSLKTLKDALATGKQSLDATSLMGTAAQYIGAGAYRAARIAYKNLHENYTDILPALREQNLYSLITISAALGEMEENRAYVSEFAKMFPESKQLNVLNTMSLESLYVDGKYEQCVKEADAALASTTPLAPKVKETAQFVQAASLFNLGRYKEALPKLQAYLDAYPNSPNVPQLMYNMGVSYARLGQFDKASHALGRLISKYKTKEETPFLPYALFDRAMANVALNSEDTNAKAMADFDRLIKEFPEPTLLPHVWNNRGILMERAQNMVEAEKAYKEAYEAAKKADNASSKGEALYRLLTISKDGKEDRLNDAVGYADAFWKESGKEKSVGYRLQAAVAALDVLEKAKRKQDGLDRLRETIVLISQEDPEKENPLLEMAVNSYTTAYVKDITTGKGKEAKVDLEALKKHYYDFPGIKETDHLLVTMLRMAVIGVYEDVLKKIDKNDATTISTLNAEINVSFNDLKKAFKIKDMTPFALLKIGNFLVFKTERPEEAVPYFDEVIKRGGDPKNVDMATFGLAQAYGRSKDKAQVLKGIELMEKAMAKEQAKPKPDRKNLENAQFNIAQFYFNNGDFQKAADKAYDYLKNKDNQVHKIAASMLWAKAYDAMKNIDQALIGYQRVNANYTGAIASSAPAMKRTMELLFDRNKSKPDLDKPSDRLLAYKTGATYIKQTKSIENKMTIDERQLWREVETLVEKYAQNPEISAENKASLERARLKAESIK